jgi:hypothetical protein
MTEEIRLYSSRQLHVLYMSVLFRPNFEVVMTEEIRRYSSVVSTSTVQVGSTVTLTVCSYEQMDGVHVSCHCTDDENKNMIIKLRTYGVEYCSTTRSTSVQLLIALATCSY